jgi:hypothetical protein
MSQDLRARIERLHAWYCENVMPIRLTPEVERLWWEWLRAGYAGPDLRDVILYIRRQIAIGKRHDGALKLTNLIQRSEAGFIGFDQDLGLARSRANRSVDKRLAPAPETASGDTRPPTPAPAGPAPAAPQPQPPTPAAHIPGALAKLKAAIE